VLGTLKVEFRNLPDSDPMDVNKISGGSKALLRGMAKIHKPV
jgi:hypothetical protein